MASRCPVMKLYTLIDVQYNCLLLSYALRHCSHICHCLRARSSSKLLVCSSIYFYFGTMWWEG
jgi:hypothetical protein